MRFLPSLTALSLMLCAACASNSPSTDVRLTVTQDGPDAGGKTTITPEMQMQAMQLAQPGPEHEIIAKMAGDWTVASKMWMAPDQKPMEMTIDSHAEMVLGGRFLKSTAKGSFKMMGMEIPVESIGFFGYDRRNEVYTNVGFDTMGTYFITAEGTRDPETGVITVSGSDHDETFGITQEYRFEYTPISDDEFTVDLYFTNPEMTHGLDEFRMMQMVYKRK